MNQNHHSFQRRTILKTIGAGLIGSTAFAGTATAHSGPDNQRRQDSFTWANDTLYEMLEAEPHSNQDNEGNEPAHRPLWLIDTLAGESVDGAEHSPHPAPLPVPIDHVVPLGPQGVFTAQWHVHLVVDPLFDPSTQNPFNHLTNKVGDTFLTSADAINAAETAGDISVIPTAIVFTCPVRPHKGPDADR
ncbi:hypothetical protein [Haloarcula sp. JP-L23]|uniref:hypothetical protein n=1 Tax=Haloarcula sp. JP-L23 TaxID=2716717 RepID=UPI00140EA328|nr:hypothetical protein G9465_19310 [Haloarcula sp. JP-L23]